MEEQNQKTTATATDQQIGGAVTVNKIIEVLERNYGWSFYDENGKLHITEMQREYMIDVAKATMDILFS